MWKRIVQYLTVAFLLGTPAQAAAPSAENGIYIEMEDLPVVAPWEKRTESPIGYTGSGYIMFMGENTFGKPEGKYEISFTVETAGRYRCAYKYRRDREGRCEDAASDLCNDIFTRINGESWVKSMAKVAGWGRWGWADPSYNLEPGEHTFWLAGRSIDVKIDAVAIYKDGDPMPEPKGGAVVAIEQPAAGQQLGLGTNVTFSAIGSDLSWYFQIRHGGGSVKEEATGPTVTLQIPGDLNDPRFVKAYVQGNGGAQWIRYKLRADAGPVQSSSKSRISVHHNRYPSESYTYSLQGKLLGTVRGKGANLRPHRSLGIIVERHDNGTVRTVLRRSHREIR